MEANVIQIESNAEKFAYPRFFEVDDILINGDGRINQREDAGITLPAVTDSYGWDCNIMLLENAGATPERIFDVADGIPSMMRLTKITSSGQVAFAQMVEGARCRHLRGKTVTLKPTVRHAAGADRTFRYAILTWESTEDAVDSAIVTSFNGVTTNTFVESTGGTPNLAANWAIAGQLGTGNIVTDTVTELSPLAVTLNSTFNNLAVVFLARSNLIVTETLDLKWHLLPGSGYATARRRSYSEELELCRWFEGIYPSSASMVVGSGFARSTTLAECAVHLPSPYRSAVAVNLPSAGSFQLRRQGGGVIACNSIGYAIPTGKGQMIRLTMGVAAGLTAGEGVLLEASGIGGWIPSPDGRL